jgi:hypothetical protein
MLIRHGVAEIDEHLVAQVLRDEAVKSRRYLVDRFMEAGYQIAHVLEVKTRRKGQADYPASHDCQLSPLRVGGAG